MECPHCKGSIGLASAVPDDQRVFIKLEFEGELLQLRTVGEVLANMEKVLSATAKEAGSPCDVFLDSIEYGGGKFQAGILVVAQKRKG